MAAKRNKLIFGKGTGSDLVRQKSKVSSKRQGAGQRKVIMLL